MNCPKCGSEGIYFDRPGMYFDKSFCGQFKCGSYSNHNDRTKLSNQGPHCRVKELEAAIKKHREQKADDRCIFDDDELYAVLGDGIKCDRRVGDQCAMLENCRRFIEQRTEPGGWPTYVELETKLKVSQEAVENLMSAVGNLSTTLLLQIQKNQELGELFKKKYANNTGASQESV